MNFQENKEDEFVGEIRGLVRKLSKIRLKSAADVPKVVIIAMTSMSLYKNLKGLSFQQYLQHAWY